MGLQESLNDLQSTISSKSGDYARQVEKLKKAKKEIKSEQRTASEEIKKIKKPELGSNWTGTDADHYDKKRDKAYSTMNAIRRGIL